MSNSKSFSTLAGVAGLVFAAGTLPPAPAQASVASPALSAAVAAALSSGGIAASASLANPGMPSVQSFVAGSKKMHEAYEVKSAPATALGSPTGRYFVKLHDLPVVRHLASARTDFRVPAPSVNSTVGRSYAAVLAQKQDTVLQEIAARLRRPAQAAFRYVNSMNGFSMAMSPAEAANVRGLPGVTSVTPVVEHPLMTDAGPQLIGAPAIWDGSATGVATQGEGVVVGIIDTGINSDHPSFSASAGAYTHTNPLGAGTYLGYCVATPAFCNDKLIGAYDFIFSLVSGDPDAMDEPSPEDSNGHGSHTAGTTAGNPVVVEVNGIAGLDISGVAPRANIVAFDTCYTEISTGRGLCPSDATVAAIEQAVTDGAVDVLNFSIGGGSNPYSDEVSQAFLSANEAGIYIAASAGNSGPDASTVGHQEPWVSTTGASTHGRTFGFRFDLTGPASPPANTQDLTVRAGGAPVATSSLVDVPLIVSPSFADATNDGCVDYPVDAFLRSGVGGLAVIALDGDTSACPSGVRRAQALEAGAVGVLFIDDVPLNLGASGTSWSMVEADWDLVAQHVQVDPATATATITAPLGPRPGQGDVMADFSSRGPSSGLEVMKPDITGPGVNILAAIEDGSGTPGTEVGLISGTSMASPHNAGAGALLSALQPAWSPSAIKSALMLSANTAVLLEDGATPAGPLVRGNGRMAVAAAANVGLVMDESIADYEDADPANGGDPRQLNIASLYSSNCIGTANCTWTRTFTSVAAGSVTWNIGFDQPPGATLSVDVPSFTLAPGASQTVVFTADASALDPAAGFVFGQVNLTDAAALEDPLHMAVSIQGSDGVLPELVEIQTRRDAGSQGVTGLVTGAATDLTFQPLGLVRGESVSGEVSQDSANGTPFDDTSDGVFFTTFTAPAAGIRLVAEIIASESPDFDLFVGIDDGDGIPESGEVIDFAATAASLERVDIIANFPAATYWILAQNWAGSGAQPDALTLSYAFVPLVDAGNLSVEEPASHAAGVPFDIRVFFDEPAMAGGDRWYAAMGAGPDASDAFGFGVFPVDVVRGEDAVAKSVDVATAMPGDTVTYTVSVQPTLFAEPLTYTITDAIPAGMTYVPGSASVSAGAVNVAGSTLEWTLPPLSPWTYAVSESLSDASCEAPLANSGAYTDLSVFGLNPSANTGEAARGVNFGVQFPLYGVNSGTVIYFGSNGLTTLDLASIFEDGNGSNQPIPDAALPNSTLAVLWNDMVLDTARGGGYTLANLTDAENNTVGGFIEFDDMILASDDTSTIDLEVYVDARVRDGFPELVFAYDNVTGAFQTLTTGTIGIENQDGSRGIELAYNDAALQVTDGFAICFDLVAATQPETLTFQATVDPLTGPPVVITNVVLDTVDNPGSESMATSASFIAGTPSADLSVSISDGGNSAQLGSLVDYVIGVDNAGPDGASGISVEVTVPAGFGFSAASGIGWSCLEGTGTVTCTLAGVLAANASAEQLTVTLSAGGATGTATVDATVSASSFDADGSDNTASDNTSVVPAGDPIFSDGFED